MDADAVVLALPMYSAARLLEAAGVSGARHLAEAVYFPSLTVSLAYREHQVGCPLEGTGYISPSGTAIRALTLGKSLVVSDVGWFSELPGDVALKVAPGDGEIERLSLALETLCDPAVRERMGAHARELAAEHDVEHVAGLYASALEEAAGVVRALSEAQR